MALNSYPKVDMAGGKTYTGRGGQDNGGGANGSNGHIYTDPGIISLSGTAVRGGEITIFDGDDFTLEMSGLSQVAISATGAITLAVGSQYAGDDYQAVLSQAQMPGSMRRKGNY
jgi:hypothetical protein